MPTAHAVPRLWSAALSVSIVLAAGACGRPEPLNDGAVPDARRPVGDATVQIGAATVAPESEIPVHAQGFAPDAMVEIGLGMPASDYAVVRDIRTDGEGSVNTTITIPRWAMRGQSYVVVVNAPEGTARAVSEPFIVGAGGDTARVQGRLEEGVECPAVRAPGGALFTLAVRDLQYGPGTQVRVVGTIAEMSFCMQGTTLNVLSIDPV
jgi:hypothetical protein